MCHITNQKIVNGIVSLLISTAHILQRTLYMHVVRSTCMVLPTELQSRPMNNQYYCVYIETGHNQPSATHIIPHNRMSVDYPYDAYFNSMCKLADVIIDSQLAIGEEPVRPTSMSAAWQLLLRFRPLYRYAAGYHANQFSWNSAYGFAYIKYAVRRNPYAEAQKIHTN
jgi:hypothetical protein